MEQSYRLQQLYMEKAPFPYSCQQVHSPEPCHACEADRETVSEAPLSSYECEALLQLSAQSGALSTAGKPLQAFSFHIHDHCQITQCIQGALVYIVGRTHVLLTPGDTLVINEHIPHTWAAVKPDTVRRLIGFYPHSLNANAYCQCFLPYFGLLYNHHSPYILINGDFPGYAEIHSLLDQIARVNHDRPFAFDALVHNLLFSFTLHLFYTLHVSPCDSERIGGDINRILHYIDQNISGDLSLQALAAHANMNPSYFSFYFKKHLGVSFKKYVTTRKVAKAADLLRYSELTVTQILFECGFSSVSAFYNAFNSVYAVSPAEFRKIQPVDMYGDAELSPARFPR